MPHRIRVFAFALLAFAAVALVAAPRPAVRPAAAEFKVLQPITQENLTIFPVVAADIHDASRFLTLDEGIRSGAVVITEAGRVQPLMRRRLPRPDYSAGGDVNRLVLVNNSDRPLLLLAGEIVTGGKQDRVIAKDRIVPPGSQPVDLSVFCVEPGRWTAVSERFDSSRAPMAQPSVRGRAMADKDQQRVWAEVRKSQTAAVEVVAQVPAVNTASASLASTTSYAGVMQNQAVQRQMDKLTVPLERKYENLLRELRSRNAVGVVAAVNGRILWADLFASPGLLEKYWPKLVRSYAAEAMLTRAAAGKADTASAQDFLDRMDGQRQVVESEPGVFRHTEIDGDGFRVFELTSLLPKTGFDMHLAKMAEE
jgi:hypothetical protein